MKTTKKELEKYLDDIDLENDRDDAIELIALMHENPESMVRAEPPPGYEEHLMNALKKRIQTDEQSHRIESFWQSLSGWMQLPKVAWSFSLSFVVVVTAVMFFQNQGHFQQLSALNQHDTLLGTATRAQSELVERWLASVGDVSVYGSGEAILASAGSKAVDQALKNIESGMR